MFAPLTVELAVTFGFIEDGAAVVSVAVVLLKLYWTIIWAGAGVASQSPAASASEAVAKVRGMVYLTRRGPGGAARFATGDECTDGGDEEGACAVAATGHRSPSRRTR